MKSTFLLAALAVAGLGVSAASFATVKTMQGPPDTVMLTPSPLPGYAIAKGTCTGCHSAEYMAYQPPNAGRAYWDATVHKMKNVFNAPVEDADIPAIVDYLSHTYGNKQGK